MADKRDVLEPVLTDGRGYELVPRSEEELVAGLRELDAKFRAEGEPRIAVLYANSDEDPAQLSIGLGGDECTLVYDEAGMTGEGGYSEGARSDDDTEVVYAYGDSHSEFAAWMLIPREAAIAAAREFFRTGRQPTSVKWRDV